MDRGEEALEGDCWGSVTGWPGAASPRTLLMGICGWVSVPFQTRVAGRGLGLGGGVIGTLLEVPRKCADGLSVSAERPGLAVNLAQRR